MKAPMRWVLRSYPAAWRNRYGAELEALLEDSGQGWRVIPDVLKEALKMRVVESGSFAQLAIGFGLVGFLVAGVTSVMTAPVWLSSAEMKMTSAADAPRKATDQQLIAREASIQNEMMSRTHHSALIHNPQLDLYREERKTQPLEDVIERMRRRDLRVEVVRLPESGLAVKVSFQYPDQKKARDTVQALLTGFQNANQLSQRANALWQDGEVLDVLDPPSLPMRPARALPGPVGTWVVVGDVLPKPITVAVLAMTTGAAGVVVAAFLNLLAGARRFRRLAGIFGGAGLVAGAVVSAIFFASDYESSAELTMSKAPDVAGLVPAERFRKLNEEVLSRENLANIIQDPRLRLYSRDLKARPLDDVANDMRRDIAVLVSEGAEFSNLVISFRYRDRFKAQQTVQALVSRFQDADARDRPRPPFGRRRPPVNLDVFDPPSAGSRVSLRPYVPLALGSGMGVLLAGLVRLVRGMRPLSAP